MEQTAFPRRLLPALALTAALVAAYTALCAAPGPGIWPNVTALGEDLGGLTVPAAAQALEAVPLPHDRGVILRAENGAGEERAAAIPLSAVTVDGEATARRACAVGRSLPFPLRGGALLGCLLAGVETDPVLVPGPGFAGVLDGIDHALGTPVVPSRWQADDRALILTKGEPGALLDREEARETLLTALGEALDGTGSPRVTLRLATVLPAEPKWARVLDRVGRPVRDAVYDKSAGTFQTERTGLTFDPDTVGAAFAAMDWGETRKVPLTVTEPSVTLADLGEALYRDTLGTCTTSIAGSAARLQNITLAASLFDGTVLLPGETFSYNDAVGSRTAARGFLPAPVYVSGQTVQETGGGVCQGSSTLYLAALRADLGVVERHNHGYVPRYVPDGMDAAVYYGVKDLKLRNDSPFPVKLTASVEGRALTVAVLGTAGETTVTVTNRTLGTTGYRTVYKASPDLAPGRTRVAVTPYTGCTVEVYRNRWRDGSLVETVLENTSVYRSRDRVVLVSPADRRRYGV